MGEFSNCWSKQDILKDNMPITDNTSLIKTLKMENVVNIHDNTTCTSTYFSQNNASLEITTSC